MSSPKLFAIAIFVFAILFPGSKAKMYHDNLAIASRVPGDKLLHSGRAVQKLSFPAVVYVEVRYPEVLPHSDYMLTHISVEGKDDTGYIDTKVDQGGPGSDYMRVKVILNQIKTGDFQYNLYGKKK